MFINELLFVLLLIVAIVYMVVRVQPQASDSTQSVLLILSWSLAVFATLFTLSLISLCQTDTPTQRSIYILLTLLIVANSVVDTVAISKGKMPRVPTTMCHVRMLTLVGLVVLLSFYGIVRTRMFADCSAIKALIRQRYAQSRSTSMSRQQKIGIAERIIELMGLSPSKTRRILRI
jgi:quinol-cytochrome oxidoreductase complex cytochrome b subunit